MFAGIRLAAALMLLFAWTVGTAAQSSDDKQREIAQWMKMLKSNDVDQRRQAAEALGKYGTDAKAAASALVAALKDPDPFVRRFAARSLGNIGADPKVATASLVPLFRSGSREEMEAANETLVKMGPATVPVFIGLLKEKDTTIILTAARSLGRFGKDAKDAVPQLIEIYKTPPKGPARVDMEIRKAVAETLGNIGPDAKAAIDPMKASVEIKNPDRELLQIVNVALKKIGSTPAKPLKP